MYHEIVFTADEIDFLKKLPADAQIK